MPTFDFSEYIVSQIPSLSQSPIKIQLLSGGFVNLTARALFDIPTVFHSQELRSVILKYAPPYMASDPTQALTTSRQTVEAWALNVLSGADPSFPEASTVAAAFPEVQIPKCIYHDDTQKVLWISDLGSTRSLSEYLCCDRPPSLEDVARIATQVTGFLAQLLRATSPAAAKANESLSGSSHSSYLIGEWLANTAGKIMAQFGIPDAEHLTLVMLHSEREKTEEPCYGTADMWPGNILITTAGKCAFVDWELFDITTAGSSIGLFVGHFHVLLFNDQVSSGTKEVIQVFMTNLLRAWKKYYGEQASLYFRHRFLLAYGSELMEGTESSPVKLSDASKAQLAIAGAQSLRAAGSSSRDVDPSRLEGQGDIWQTLWEDVHAIFRG